MISLLNIMCASDWKLNAMINENETVIDKLDRSKGHYLIGKYSHVRFNKQKMLC